MLHVTLTMVFICTEDFAALISYNVKWMNNDQTVSIVCVGVATRVNIVTCHAVTLSRVTRHEDED